MLLGCPDKNDDRGSIDTTDTTEITETTTPTTGDTGLCVPFAATPVDDPPCDDTGPTDPQTPLVFPVAEVASARAHGTDQAQYGYAIEVSGDHVLVGQTLASYTTGQPATVFVLALPSLETVGSWESDDLDSDQTGAALATADIDGDGVMEIAVGRAYARGELYDARGAAHVVRSLPIGEQPLPSVTELTFYGPEFSYLGVDVAFAALGPDPCEVELIAGGIGSAYSGIDGGVWATDAEGTGDVYWSAAARSIRGPYPFGADFASLDLDGDGQLDLPVRSAEGVSFFQGPWVGDLQESDRTAAWTHEGVASDLGNGIQSVGDVDGDGYPDLAFVAHFHPEPEVRAGRAYLVPGGSTPVASVPADDLPTQFRGQVLGDGMGYAVTSGDLDGDGQLDLVIGASGVFPGFLPGKVLVYPGPVCPAVRTADDAAIVLTGEADGDLFSRALATVDVDHDGRDDLLAVANGPEVLYLINAASLGL